MMSVCIRLHERRVEICIDVKIKLTIVLKSKIQML